MLYLYDHAELRQVSSSILHYLDSKMKGMPEDCLSEVWAMAHPQIEGLERATRISISADGGSAFSALQGSDDASLKLLFSDNIDYCVHTPPAYIYIMYKGNSLNRILRSTSFVRDLHDELRPWSADDPQIRGVFSATNCDTSYVYGATLFSSLMEIDVDKDI
ncbi:hypothetical protein FOZ63_028489 [Perkinsus olseni]|uniref:Uncharacterized protein n=1 Tax=Perkinsus olseni TaxID=32597 RepID=A0A7J6SQZ7_PEROL|nr:hypothetical protein FOZ62_018700 [Perkinsus olseni]KAF4734982.1 hypothetical protein FOZ63_028489 [Perkinsus olseni]